MSPTPAPESSLRRQFLDALAARLEVGAKDYGNQSFRRPETAEELLDELLDVAGWAYVSWVRMRIRLREIELAADKLEAGKDWHPLGPFTDVDRGRPVD